MESEDKMPKVELDEFHYHEVIDRLMIMHNHYYDDIMNHPVIKQSEELTVLAEDIFKKLSLLNIKINLDEIENIGN
jgi:hypothetical protein